MKAGGFFEGNRGKIERISGTEAKMTGRFTWRSTAMLGLMFAVLSGTAFADGAKFFEPARTDGPIDLVYVGRVSDKGTGTIIRDLVYLKLSHAPSGLHFDFMGDKPGHYRSPDVGAFIKGVVEGPIKATDLQLDVALTGYKPAVITVMPRKTIGVVEVDIKLEKDESSLRWKQ
jgi:hypothetical protein